MKYFTKTAVTNKFVDTVAAKMVESVNFIPWGQTRTVTQKAVNAAKGDIIKARAHQIKNKRKYFIQDKTEQAYRHYEGDPTNWPEIKLRKEMQGI